MKEINNNIQEAYCSFEVSKLLKEKGFDCYTTTWHQRGNGIVGDVVGRSDRYNSKGEAYTSHPTQALALEWLRVNFGIHIFTKQNFDFHMMPSISTGFNFWITETRDSKYVNRDLIDEDVMCLLYDTPQEAIGAALLYVLKNLIMATEKDLKYALKKLVLAINGYTDAVNAYPLTKKNFEHLQKMDLELQTALSLAKDLIE